MNKCIIPLLAAFALTFSLPVFSQPMRYDFGSGPVADGWTAVSAQAFYGNYIPVYP